jgi:PTS system N-acetylgalactosamine-specific IIA component
MWDGICRTMTSSSAADRGRPVHRAVVAGHGDFAAGIISAVQQIAGVGHVFCGISNAALDATALDATLREAVSATHADVIFTDLQAGSCTIAARRLAREVPGLTVITGANLSMLLDFALASGPPAGAAERAAARGRDAITVTAPSKRPESGHAH